MATIKDVARLAGVSTYHRFSRNQQNTFVIPATQEKANKAVDELNYAPSAVARNEMQFNTYYRHACDSINKPLRSDRWC